MTLDDVAVMHTSIVTRLSSMDFQVEPTKEHRK
jgi:hypothetical protein